MEKHYKNSQCFVRKALMISRPQGVWRGGKGFEICIAGLEFESGRAPLVKAWDSRGFTHSPEATKMHCPGDGISSNPKKKNFIKSLNLFNHGQI